LHIVGCDGAVRGPGGQHELVGALLAALASRGGGGALLDTVQFEALWACSLLGMSRAGREVIARAGAADVLVAAEARVAAAARAAGVPLGGVFVLAVVNSLGGHPPPPGLAAALAPDAPPGAAAPAVLAAFGASLIDAPQLAWANEARRPPAPAHRRAARPARGLSTA
jgi:hypothetical protein